MRIAVIAADVLAVQNPMSYYAPYSRAGQTGKLLNLFALKTPGRRE